jgi:hypothetical protein
MTDPTASAAASAAPGWYPDGTGGQRWWNGSGWSEHTAPAAAGPAQSVQRPGLPAGARIDTAWVWIVSVGYLLSIIPVFFFDMNGYIAAIFDAQLSRSPAALSDALVGYAVFGIVSWLLGLIVWGLAVFGAYRDYKHLEAIGVERPFHWAFAFIPYPIVYLIGRHVVLRKVSRTAGWPLWAHIGSYALVFLAMGIWMIVAMRAMFDTIAQYPGTFS